MKYIVMECHGGYAVLMDEAARFVKAANVHYKVGQTVTDPILMEKVTEKTPSRNITVIRRFAAAAASLAVFAGMGYGYYYQNVKPHSSVIICAASDICLSLNTKGHVISVTTDDPAGEAIIKEYDYKGKDKMKVAGDILEIDKSKGLISSGDSVRMYVNADDPLDSDTYKSELEDGMKGLDLNISVLEIGQHPAPPDPVPPPIQDQPAPGKDKKDDKPAKPAETSGKPDPGSESHPDAPAPPEPAKDGHKANEGPAAPPKPAHSDDAPAPAAPDVKAEDPPPPPVEGEKPAPEAPGEDTPAPPAPDAENEDKPAPPSPPEPAEQGDDKPAVRLPATPQAPAAVAVAAAPIPPEPHEHPPFPEDKGSPENQPAPEAPGPIDHPVDPEAEGPLS